MEQISFLSLTRFTEQSVHRAMKGQTTWASQSGVVALLLRADAAAGENYPRLVAGRNSTPDYPEMWVRSWLRFPHKNLLTQEIRRKYLKIIWPYHQNQEGRKERVGRETLTQGRAFCSRKCQLSDTTTHPRRAALPNLPPHQKVFSAPEQARPPKRHMENWTQSTADPSQSCQTQN